MTPFVDFLVSLAPEGETALVVRQKPQLKDGELQFHADGAVKCTWPAYLPTQRMKEGEAWYGNTASFIIDRFEDGRVSASAAHCAYVLLMVLDDLGTKSPERPAPPSWTLETSPGTLHSGDPFMA